MGLAESRPTLRWSALVSSTPRLVIAWRRDTLHPARLRCLTEPTVDRCSDASTGFVEACHPPKEYGMICSLCTFNYARLYIYNSQLGFDPGQPIVELSMFKAAQESACQVAHG